MKKHTVFKTITIILVIITTVFFASVMTVFADETATEVNVPAVTKVDSGNWGMYASASMWLSLGASFSNADESDEVKFFITDKKDGKEEDCVNGYILTTTVADTPDVGNSLRISKTTGFQVESLAPGTYYIGCKLVSGESVTYQYRPFIVFPTAKEYVKAALDLMITEAYMKDNTGYFYDEQGVYQGLGGNTYSDTGVDWECWIFSSLGDDYKTEDGQIIDMSIDGAFLSSESNKTYLDYLEDQLEYTEDNGFGYSNKDLFRYTTALSACGADPRNFNKRNFIRMMIDRCYYDDGTPRIMKSGRLAPEGVIDSMSISYLILALEISGASSEEGYTDEIRKAALESILYYTKPKYDANGNVTTGTDGYAMTLLPLQFFKDIDEERVLNRFEEFSSILRQYYLSANAAVSYTTTTDSSSEEYKANNMNTAAVMLNALVSTGLKPDDLEDEMWQRRYGSFLTTFMSGITDSGEALYGTNENRMASYQTLGALVELFNEESCFKTIQRNYKHYHPEYFPKEEDERQDDTDPENITDDTGAELKKQIKSARSLMVKGFKVKGKKAKAIAVFCKNKKASGYQVQYATKKKFKKVKNKTVRGYKKKGVTIKKLARHKSYYFRIRTYKVINGKKYYGKWSKAVRKKIK